MNPIGAISMAAPPPCQWPAFALSQTRRGCRNLCCHASRIAFLMWPKASSIGLFAWAAPFLLRVGVIRLLAHNCSHRCVRSFFASMKRFRKATEWLSPMMIARRTANKPQRVSHSLSANAMKLSPPIMAWAYSKQTRRAGSRGGVPREALLRSSRQGGPFRQSPTGRDRRVQASEEVRVLLLAENSAR